MRKNVKIPVETAQEIANIFALDLGPDQALTALTDGTIGIATEGEKGYTPTRTGLIQYNYEKLSKLCDEANALIFPKRDPRVSFMIVLRSMA